MLYLTTIFQNLAIYYIQKNMFGSLTCPVWMGARLGVGGNSGLGRVVMGGHRAPTLTVMGVGERIRKIRKIGESVDGEI